MREIVLDTETTGLDPGSGHRVVEIGCVELINHIPTAAGQFHCYINPQREMPEEAYRVHGLSAEFLADKAVFADICQEFLDFIGDDKLVIHNASFDMKFLNAELAALDRPVLEMSRTIDTVGLARRKFPGSPASLDALCRRFSIDLSRRSKHGALLDAELLAEVYLELIGGRQTGLEFAGKTNIHVATQADPARGSTVRAPRAHQASAAELAAHETFISTIKDPIWRRD